MTKQSSNPNNDHYLHVDFHCHTIFSPDSLVTPERLIATCRAKSLDKVVVTDHNTIQGAVFARTIAPKMIIVGEEIMTTKGELLAFFVQEEIPSGLDPTQVIQLLKAQEAFISVSHPFDKFRKGHWNTEDLLKILPDIDAIETFNARCIFPSANWKAIKFAKEHGLSGTYGSDAHSTIELGHGSLFLPPFSDRLSLKQSLSLAYSPRLILSPPWVHLFSRYASWRKRRGIS
ncbi:MAG: PHP domain-containing protein [Anaerolineales bacterium]|nr:PHP domain-containing protein [Anaerolineales bacterium]